MEIVLIDYKSTDGLSEWIWNNFEKYIVQKKLIFFEVKNDVLWNVSKAKNLAHSLSSKKYLFNLDADNFISQKDIDEIKKASAHEISCHQFSVSWPDGSYGRIGIAKNLFVELGGYDKSFLAMGGQNVDLLRRIRKHKKNIIKLAPPEIMAIQNDKSHKILAIRNNTANAEQHYKTINNFNLTLSNYKITYEGAIRKGSYATYFGLLNGKKVIIDGFITII